MTSNSASSPNQQGLAVCIHNRTSALSRYVSRSAPGLEQEYYLTMGRSYVVAGMSGFDNGPLDFLVRDDYGDPCFVPAEMFELHKLHIPSGWLFSMRGKGRTIWGYENLVMNPDHAGELEEGDPKALALFFAELMRLESGFED